MSVITFSPTKGEAPIVGFGQAPDIAECAINTKFWHGLLQPHQCPTLHCEKGFTIKTMHSFDRCDCVAWDKCVDVADCYCYFVFWTGDGKPKISTHDEVCNGSSCDLGVPCPKSAPSLSIGGGGNDCDEQFTKVVYRYVNKYGHVGAPSQPSNIATTYGVNGESMTLSNIEPPSGDHCINKVEIFLLVAGNKTGVEKQVTNNSGYMSVGIFPISESISFNVGELGFELDSSNYFPPPENLQGITCHEFGLVGFEGKNIWYTEANKVSAWSGKKCLDYEIKQIEHWNGSLYVFTDSWIYRLDLERTEGGYNFSTPFRFGDKPFPIIGKASKGQSGIFFPSIMGGVLVSGNDAKVITTKFSKDDWLSLCHKDCKSMTAIFDYGVGIFTEKASYIYEFGDGSFGELQGNLYQLPFIADAVYTDKNGILNYTIGSKWYKWDNCFECKKPCDKSVDLSSCCCPYTWESKRLIFDSMARLTAGYIEFVAGTGDVKLEVFESDCYDQPMYEKTFNEGTDQCRKSRCFRKYFRIPACAVRDAIFIRLTGCAHVRRVVLGTSRSSLKGS